MARLPRLVAQMERLRNMDEAEIAATSPPELSDLPEDFWDDAQVVIPPPKEAISLRVDGDVLEWFRKQGPKYQTHMNAVLRSYRSAMEGGAPRRRRQPPGGG